MQHAAIKTTLSGAGGRVEPRPGPSTKYVSKSLSIKTMYCDKHKEKHTHIAVVNVIVSEACEGQPARLIDLVKQSHSASVLTVETI